MAEHFVRLTSDEDVPGLNPIGVRVQLMIVLQSLSLSIYDWNKLKLKEM